MKRLLLLSFLVSSSQLFSQTTFYWRSEATDANWSTAGNWWNGALSGWGFGIQNWDNNHETTQNNDVSSAFTHSLVFSAGCTSDRDMNGNSLRLYDYGGTDPRITNNSTASITFDIALEGDGDAGDPLKFQINSTGNLVFAGNVNNQGSWIDIEGSGGGSVTISGEISGSGGLYKTGSTTLNLSGNNTYTDNTTINAGTINVNSGGTLGSGSDITVETGAILNINESITVASLTIVGTGEVNIAEGQSLTITGNLSNAGTITLNASAIGYAQLKVDGSVSGSGSVTVEQYVANAGWHNLAIPVDISSLDDLGNVGDKAGTGAQNTFYWDPSTTPQWVNQTASDNDVQGRGYLVYVGNYGIAAAPATISLSGSPYTSASPSVSYGTGDDQDWNLIANPFTCSLDFNALDVGNSGTNVNNSFAIWDPLAAEGNGGYVSVSPISPASQKIAPLQSFWVQTTDPSPDPSPAFPSMSMATHGTVGSSPTYYKSQSVIADRLFLHTYQASNPQLEDELLIGFIPGASDGNDNAYDAGKRIGNNVAPHLMTVSGGKELAINAIDYGPLSAKPKLLQLRFVSAKNNEDYFIALEDSLLTNEYRIVLEDKKLSKRHDLNSRAYRFTHDVTEEYRFVLHLEPLVERLDEHTQVVVAAGSGSGRFFIIYFKDGSSAEPMEGALYDLQGRKVQSFTVPAGQDRVEVSTQDLPTGIYLLKIQTPNGLHAEKILID
jgi:autotransporter-associated beta strand protein